MINDPAFAEITLFGCLSYCRRYSDMSVKVTESPTGPQLARAAINDFLGKVFFIERHIVEQRLAGERGCMEPGGDPGCPSNSIRPDHGCLQSVGR
jgi:hypothetical protein